MTVTKVEPNIGNFNSLVIAEDTLRDNVHPASLRMFDSAPNQHLYGILFNGGNFANTHLPNLMAAVTDAISNHADPAMTTVFTVNAANPDYGRDRTTPNHYASLLIFGIHVTNPVDRVRLRDQRVFAADGTYTFWLLSDEDVALPWVSGMYVPSIRAGTPAAATALRAAVAENILTSPKVGILLDQYTYTHDRSPLPVRRYKLSQSVDPQWKEHLGGFMVYIKPCTVNPTHWHAITAAICDGNLRHSYHIFKSLIDPSRCAIGPRCVICKNEDHFTSVCPFTKDPQWWGPKTQISGITEGPLAPVSNRGARGGCGGNRGGHGGHGTRGRGTHARGVN